MERRFRTLRMYGKASPTPALEWRSVERQLADAGTYWVVATGSTTPHPRPIWGIWTDDLLYLSIGSPTLSRLALPGAAIAVHLDSGTDVVVVEGEVAGSTVDRKLLASYSDKYDRAYEPREYGPLTTVSPHRVLAWQSAGWAGSGSFQRSGCWDFRLTDPS